MHFLPGDAKGLSLVDKFDAEALARQVQSVRAKYFVIVKTGPIGALSEPKVKQVMAFTAALEKP